MKNSILKYYMLISWIIGLFSTLSYSQNYNLQVQEYGLEDGLSSYNISYIYQDSRGFVWFATDYGLNRYDGRTFKVYTKEENHLCSNLIFFISEDEKGNLWLLCGGRGTPHCHVVFDPIKEKVYSLSEYTKQTVPFPEDQALSSPMTNGSIMYVINAQAPSPNCTYYEYNGATFQQVFQQISDTIGNLSLPEAIYRLPNEQYALLCFSEHKILILEKSGNLIETYQCPDKTPHLVGVGNNYGVYNILCMDESTPYPNIYFDQYGTKDTMGLFPIGAGNRFGHRDKLGYRLTLDSLYIYDSIGQVIVNTAVNSSLNNFSSSFYISNNGNIWTRNDDAVLLLKAIKQPLKVDLSSTTNLSRWRGIMEMADGKLCASGYEQFLYQSPNDTTWNRLPIDHDANFAYNYLGLAASGSKLWIGAERGKLLSYDWKKKHLKTYPINRVSTDIIFLVWQPFIAKDGTVWVGTSKGLFYLDQQTDAFKSLDDKTYNLSSLAVYAFHENKKGLWLCTNNGLYLMDLKARKIVRHFSSNQKDKNYIPSSHIAHLHEDANGIFWLATKGEGLIMWNPSTYDYHQYTQNGAGLSHNVLYAVYGDNFGKLWMSSQRGLMQFDIETETVKTYLKQDGLMHNEFNTISHHQAADGHLYFGGQNGIVHFDPKDFQDKAQVAPLVITEYSKESIETGEQTSFIEDLLNESTITLTPDDKSFRLEFSLLDYLNAKNHQYSYKIENYDNNWIYQSSNIIKINVLPYGTYQLKLRAKSANSGIWVDYPDILTIKVLKPFYLQTWFLALTFLLILLTIYSIFQWRIKLLKHRQEELEEIVQERTIKIEKDKAVIEAQAEELKALDKVKSKFFANISHELRTPLTLILGPLSYILDHPNAWEEEAVKKQLLTMQRNGKSLMQLIEEILDLSKLEANKLELLEEPTSVKQFFEYIFAVFVPQFQHQELDYTLNVQLLNSDLVIDLDRKKMERILNNFLSNALKFTPKKGKISLSVVELKNGLKIQVSDTGKGVHPSDLPHIFERFYQSNQANQQLYGGTGIGLALVQEFALLMGGKTYVESVLGQGSNFYVEIPKKIASKTIQTFGAATTLIEEELIDSIGTDFTILIVEDNKDMRDFVSQLLQQKYKVITAENGVEGLTILETKKDEINLIVSDVMMPEMDGFTFLKNIKSSAQWYTIPVVMLTALAAERDKLKALTIGVDDYLTKPFSASELFVRIQNLLYNYCQRLEWQKLNRTENNLENRINSEDAIRAVDQDWILSLEEVVKKSLQDRLVDVERLAASVFLSKRQLHRKIKAITGLTPAKFIKEVQLQAARKELESGVVLSITEVAFNNAFEFPATFSTVFKKRFGISPSDYLKHVQGVSE